MARTTRLVILIKNIYTLWGRKCFLLPAKYFPTNLVYPFTLRVTGIKTILGGRYSFKWFLILINNVRCSAKGVRSWQEEHKPEAGHSLKKSIENLFTRWDPLLISEQLEGSLGLQQQQFPYNGVTTVQMHFLLKKITKRKVQKSPKLVKHTV